MAQPRRAALVAAAALLLSPLAAGGPADAAAEVTARLTGTLLTVPAEVPGQDPEYAVQADGGELVAVEGDFPEELPGSRFEGRVDVSRLDGSTPQARLAVAEREHRPLRVTSYTLTAEPEATVEQAQAATSHRWFVAAPANFGGFAMTDSEILSRIGWVAAYWKKQSNGVITDIAVPATITRYTASATSEAAGCGLTGSDFTATVQEAAASFPGASFGGTDQLLVLMPPSCTSGGVVGRGTLPGRLSFGNGYYSITKTSSSYFEWTLAHELGHNYGFGHSSLGPCSPSCVSTYGDYYSVMGGAISGKPIPPVLGTVSRELQGVTDAGEAETVTGSATRRLAPRSATSGLRALRVTDPSSGQELLLDYRSGTGDDATTYYAGGSGTTAYRKGVVVEARNGSNALQLRPADGDRKALVAGESLTLGTTTVSVTSMDGTGATVVVTVPGVPEAYPEPGSVSLSAAPVAGTPVSAALSGWTPQPTSVAYQWLVDGSPVGGAVAASYTPTVGQVGKDLSVRVVAGAAGYQDATVTSADLTVAAPPISLTGATSVSGTPQVGRELVCSAPGWAQPPASVTTAFAWRSDGATIPGAATDRFTPTAAERGHRLACEVTLSAPGYAAAASTSTETAAVAKGVLTTSKPVVKGRAKVGRTLRAATGTWTEGVTLRYRWYVGGERVHGQRGPTFAVKNRMVGAKVKLVVVGKLPGYATVTRKSRATAPVRPA